MSHIDGYMKDEDVKEITETLDFNDQWWNDVAEGEPVSLDEITEVLGLIAMNRQLLTKLAETQAELEDQRARANIAHANAEAKSERMAELHRELAEKEAELEHQKELFRIHFETDHWKRMYDTVYRDRQIEIGRHAETRMELNKAVEALDKIKRYPHGAQHDKDIADKALQSIKEGETQ